MFVGVCRLVLHLRDNDSLKGKRRVLKSILDRTRSKFNAAVAEVEANDDHKRAVIGVAVIGNDAAHVDSMMSKISGFVEWTGLAPVSSCETELISIGDELGFGRDNRMWNPDEEEFAEWSDEEER